MGAVLLLWWYYVRLGPGDLGSTGVQCYLILFSRYSPYFPSSPFHFVSMFQLYYFYLYLMKPLNPLPVKYYFVSYSIPQCVHHPLRFILLFYLSLYRNPIYPAPLHNRLKRWRRVAGPRLLATRGVRNGNPAPEVRCGGSGLGRKKKFDTTK